MSQGNSCQHYGGSKKEHFHPKLFGEFPFANPPFRGENSLGQAAGSSAKEAGAAGALSRW
jgi:hypothetical protein